MIGKEFVFLIDPDRVSVLPVITGIKFEIITAIYTNKIYFLSAVSLRLYLKKDNI